MFEFPTYSACSGKWLEFYKRKATFFTKRKHKKANGTLCFNSYGLLKIVFFLGNGRSSGTCSIKFLLESIINSFRAVPNP